MAKLGPGSSSPDEPTVITRATGQLYVLRKLIESKRLELLNREFRRIVRWRNQTGLVGLLIGQQTAIFVLSWAMGVGQTRNHDCGTRTRGGSNYIGKPKYERQQVRTLGMTRLV